jgi:branched-chain amino acid transport system permease protein
MTAPSISLKGARQGLRKVFRGERGWALGYLILAIVIFIFFYLMSTDMLSETVQNFANTWFPLGTVNECLVWVMCALGLNIVVGYAGLLDLGYVAFWAIGGYVAGWLMSAQFHNIDFVFGGTRAPFTKGGIHLHWTVVLVAAAAACALLGVIIGAPTLRLRSDYLALVTLGFGEIIPEVIGNGEDIGGLNMTNGKKGIQPIDPIQGPTFTPNGSSWTALGPFDNLGRYILLVALVALILFMSLMIRRGRLGRAWLAIREDELAASAMGVPLMKTKLSAYAVGAVAGGLGGAAFAIQIAAAQPDKFDFSISITLLAMVVLGGMGNVWGVMLGALLLSWFNSTGLRQGSNAFNEAAGTNIDFTQHTFLIFGAALVLMMLFRREGFIPESRTRLVLREPGRTESESLGADMEQQAPELDRAVEQDAALQSSDLADGDRR